jgi:ribonuclease P protein component
VLPAQHRLRDRRDFSLAVRGARSGNRLMVVHATLPAGRQGLPPRVGLAVSRAVGNAVVRNRTKRILRARVATLLPELPDGFDLVIRAQPALAGAGSQELTEALHASVRGAVRATQRQVR